MTIGDTIGGYTVLEDFRVVGAGLSEWTFAERGGRIYFLKRFLSPTYPDDAAPGSPQTKARKRKRCAAFEAHHRGIMAALAPLTRNGGNLITTLDFFRSGAKYYKVTEKVDIAGLSAAEIAALPFSAKTVLLKTVAHSLRILHDLEIVHGDLKPSNALIKRTELGHTAKLIDFDSSYMVGNPPPPDEIVGTMNYYSPELVRYIQGAADGSELTAAADIFALGLVYAEYLTGSLPRFESDQDNAAIAVLNGSVLRLSPSSTPPPVVALVEQMLLADPAGRPDIATVHATLMNLGRVPPTKGTAPPRPSPAVALAAAKNPLPTRPLPAPATLLRGAGMRIAAGVRREPAPAPPPPPARVGGAEAAPARSGLVGKLLGRMAGGNR